jgi:hypothetical protein
MSSAHVQVVLDGQTMPTGLEAALRRVGATASFGPISEAIRLGPKPTADAVVVVAPENSGGDQHRLRALFDRIATKPRATLVLQPSHATGKPPAQPTTLPVSFSGPGSTAELAARITTMIEMRPSLESLGRRAPSRRHPDESLAHQYRQQLRLASQVQRELLPHTLPRFDGVSFSAVYCPRDYVSGDIYDIRRLDADHVAVALVDAEGHGISAALLTVFIKRALRGDGRRGGPARPDEVLARLNEELLEADLTEPQFAAAVYVLLHLPTRRVELARGGAPYPIVRHADGRCELMRPSGPVVGVMAEASFMAQSFELAAGESLILHSDGLEGVTSSAGAEDSTSAPLAKPEGSGVGGESARPDEGITATRWYARLRDEGVEAALEEARLRHDTLRRLGCALDDLTVLAINACD